MRLLSADTSSTQRHTINKTIAGPNKKDVYVAEIGNKRVIKLIYLFVI